MLRKPLIEMPNICHMDKDQLISMIHFLEERGKESECENKELKDMVKELTEIHNQDLKIHSNFMESVDKLTNQVY